MMKLLVYLLLIISSADRAEDAHFRAVARCARWHDTALAAGWPRHLLPRLDAIMWRESRCQPTAFNPTDPNGGSVGLTQINLFWCAPTRYYPTGYLQAVGALRGCGDLADPGLNLRAALAVWQYADARHGDGWAPWAP